MLICVSNGDVDLAYVIEVIPAGSPHCEVTPSPFEVKPYLEGGAALNRRAEESP